MANATVIPTWLAIVLVFVTAALDAAVTGPENTLDELATEGQDVVVEVSGTASGQTNWAGTAEGVMPA